MKRLLKLMFGDWAEIKLVLFVAIILLVLIYISTLEILPSSEGFLFNYTYL